MAAKKPMTMKQALKKYEKTPQDRAQDRRTGEGTPADEKQDRAGAKRLMKKRSAK
jgi:hypothetical protein